MDIERVGRRRLSVNGRDVDRASLRAGDYLEIGNQLGLFCSERPTRLPGEPAKRHPFGMADDHGLVGESPAAWKLRESMNFIGPRAGHVLVRGDSGTGKELVARGIHHLSHRSGAFVPRNAATIPETLIDAELFGNSENYPNPGMRERKGLVGAADKGTLFLDEFADLPVKEQAHLLRVLDAGEYQRLGETAPRRSELRLVGATNRPESMLRADVLARFDFTIEVPSLLSRREDIPLLLRRLIQVVAADDASIAERFRDDSGMPRFSAALMRRLIMSPPPGNVRGLRKALWQAIESSRDDVIDLPEPQEAQSLTEEDETLESPDASLVQAALNASHGSIEKAWRSLGLSSRFALMRLMKKHGITVQRRVFDGDGNDARTSTKNGGRSTRR